eukprot:4333488-Pleurochrysis_carterae.AAC.3
MNAREHLCMCACVQGSAHAHTCWRLNLRLKKSSQSISPATPSGTSRTALPNGSQSSPIGSPTCDCRNVHFSTAQSTHSSVNTKREGSHEIASILMER